MKELPRATVLIAEDDPDDQLLLAIAFNPYEDSLEVSFVEDGEQLMEYLDQRGRYADPVRTKPELILLDLNMPKLDGRQALVEIKRRPGLKDIPVVIWTTSNENEDKVFCRKNGAADFITKPVEMNNMRAVVKGFVKSWLPDIREF